MKKLLATLMILTLLPVYALATPETIDIEAMSVTEIRQLKARLDDRLVAIQAEQAPKTSSSVHYEGDGMAMIPIPEFPFYPCRMVYTADAAGDATVEITGGKFGWKEDFKLAKNQLTKILSYDSHNYGQQDLTLLVTAKGKWSLDITPLGENGALAFSGTGSNVSNTFALSSPVPVTVECQAKDYDFFWVTLETPSDYGYLSENIVSESVSSSSRPKTFEAFIKPNSLGNGENVFYKITCAPTTKWSIYPTGAKPVDVPTPTKAPVLRQGDKGEAVKVLQQRLIDLGYLEGRADGGFGSMTAAAVKAFQVATGREPTGIADEALQSELFADEAPVKLTPEPTVAPTPVPTPEPTQAQRAAPPQNITVEHTNALGKAQLYLGVMPFSYKGLIEQLEYDQYPHEAAVYAADHCGADWNEQAAKKAETYLSLMSFSRGGLIDQLKYDGFTQAQATYGAERNGY